MNRGESSGKENKTNHEEWPGYKCERPGGLLGKSVPLLIMELHRLEPFFEDNCPRIHVLNMPDARIRQVEIVGIVRKIYPRSRLDISVDDGTGRAQVLYAYENLEKAKEERKHIDAKFSRLEKVAKIKNCGPDHMKALEKRWMQETKNGSLGKKFKIFDYVHVIGSIYLDYGYFSVSKKDVSLETAKLCKPVINAKIIYQLTEKEYNEKLQTWISGVVKDRYQKR